MDKVAVHLHCLADIAHAHLEPVLCGIEEEGVPWHIVSSLQSDVCQAGADAARESRLGVGLGISADTVTLHHEKLGARPVFSEPGCAMAQRDDLRRIGANSARLIKGIPFLFPGDHP